MKSYCLPYEEVLSEPLGGSERRILAYGKALMMVEMKFEAGAEGKVHSHEHTQCTYVVSGKFVFNCEGKEWPVGEGDSLFLAPNEAHGVKCLEAGTLLDVFTPQRDDFLR